VFQVRAVAWPWQINIDVDRADTTKLKKNIVFTYYCDSNANLYMLKNL